MPFPKPPFTVQTYFVDSDGRGWTEHFFVDTDLTQSGYNTMFNTMIPLRMKMSPDTVKCVRLKANSAQNRGSYVVTPSTTTTAIGTYAGVAMPAEVALDIRLRGQLSYYNKIFMRGVPEDCIAGDDTTITTAFQTAFTDWSSYLVGNGHFTVRSVIGATPQPKTIISIKAGQPKGLILETPQGAGLTPGQVIQIHNGGLPAINGYHNVVTGPLLGAATETYTLGGARISVNPPGGTGSYYTIPVPAMHPLSDVQIVGVGQRKAGRPFGLIAGREATTWPLRP